MLESNTYHDYQKFSATLSHRLKGFFYDFFIFIFAGLVVFLIATFLIAGKSHIQNATVYGVSHVIMNTAISNDKTLRYFKPSGEASSFNAPAYRDIPALAESISTLKTSSLIALAIAIIPAFISMVFGRKFLSQFRKVDEGQHLRGGELVDHEVLKKFIIEQGLQSEISFGPLPIVKAMEGRHFMASGDTGVGKSQLIMNIMDVIRARKKKLVIFDKSGEFIQHYYDPSKGDKILAPFDDRSEYWSPFAEGSELFDFERLAFSFLPIPANMDESKKHWPEAAITTFSWFLYRLHELYGGHTISPDDLFKKFIGKKEVTTETDEGEFTELVREFILLLEGTPGELVTDRSSPEHASSVVGSLIPKIRALWYMRGLEHKPAFSLRNWVQNDNETGWVFIRASNDQMGSVKPLITAWLDTVISAVLSLPKSSEREVWCLIDELQSLDKLASVENGLFEGRKHGLRMLLGFTSISKLNTIYGPDTVNSLVSMCGNKVLFRMSDDKTAERGAKMLLEKEVMDENKSMSFGTNDNVSANEQRNSRFLVTPSELMTLDDLNAYVRLPGNYPTTKIQFEYVDRPTISTVDVPRKLPPVINYSSSETTANPGLPVDPEEQPLL